MEATLKPKVRNTIERNGPPYCTLGRDGLGSTISTILMPANSFDRSHFTITGNSSNRCVVQPQHRRENWQFVSERISAWLSNYGVTQITTNQAGLTCYHRLLLMSNEGFG